MTTEGAIVMADKSKLEKSLEEAGIFRVIKGELSGHEKRPARKKRSKGKALSKKARARIGITGVSTYWGKRLAERLSTQLPSGRLVGIDSVKPEGGIPNMIFHLADIGTPKVIEVLKEERVERLCHLSFTPRRSYSEKTFEKNVLGTLHLLWAAREAGVKRLIIKSSSLLYGAGALNPNFITEEWKLSAQSSLQYICDAMEVERYVKQFTDETNDVSVAVLRFAPILGPRARTPLGDYLSMDPLVPVLLGFDPLMQIIHEKDVVAALEATLMAEVEGAINVAHPKVMPLLKIVRLAGKFPLPIPHYIAYPIVRFMKNIDLIGHLPIECDYLRYNLTIDTRRMSEELKFTPQVAPEETIKQFRMVQNIKKYRIPWETIEKIMKEEIENAETCEMQGKDQIG